LWHHLTRRLRPSGGLEFALARWLERRVPAASRLATGQMGMIPYYSRLRAYDLVGLTCCELSRVGRSPARLKVLKRLKPDLVLLFDLDFKYFRRDLRAGPYRLSRAFRLAREEEEPGVGARTYYLFSLPGVMSCPSSSQQVPLMPAHAEQALSLARDCIVELAPR